MRPLSAPELADLHDRVCDLMGDALLPALSRANRTGELPQLLTLLGMGELLGEGDEADLRPKRLLVLGDSMVKEPKLRSIANKNGCDPSLIDFALGYEGLKHFDFASLRYSDRFRAVLVGPMPHSTPGKRDAGSAVAEMEAHPEIYPPVIELRDATGLKITNNSFARAVAGLCAA